MCQMACSALHGPSPVVQSTTSPCSYLPRSQTTHMPCRCSARPLPEAETSWLTIWCLIARCQADIAISATIYSAFHTATAVLELLPVLHIHMVRLLIFHQLLCTEASGTISTAAFTIEGSMRCRTVGCVSRQQSLHKLQRISHSHCVGASFWCVMHANMVHLLIFHVRCTYLQPQPHRHCYAQKSLVLQHRMYHN